MNKFILLWMSLFSILPISIPYAYILSSGDDGEYNRLLWALGITIELRDNEFLLIKGKLYV